jgi:hypothetical protein
MIISILVRQNLSQLRGQSVQVVVVYCEFFFSNYNFMMRLLVGEANQVGNINGYQ